MNNYLNGGYGIMVNENKWKIVESLSDEVKKLAAICIEHSMFDELKDIIMNMYDLISEICNELEDK